MFSTKKSFYLILTSIIISTFVLSFFPATTTRAAHSEELSRPDRTPPFTPVNYPGKQGAPNTNLSSNVTTLYKVTSSPNVYFWDANYTGGAKLRWISSAESFAAWGFNWSNVQEISSFGAMTIGAPLPFAPNLVKGTDNNTYLLDHINYNPQGNIRLIQTSTIFDNFGFSWSNIRRLKDLLLTNYDFTPANLSATPTLEKFFGSSDIWLYLGGSYRYKIEDMTAFNNWHFNLADVQNVFILDGSDAGVYLPSTPILVKSKTQSTIYLAFPETYQTLPSADMYEITSATIFNNWLFSWSAVQSIDYGRPSSYWTENLESTPRLVHRGANANIYLANNAMGYAYLIPSMTVFNNWHFNMGSVTTLSEVAFDAAYFIDTNHPVPSTPYLFREEGSATVYMGMPEVEETGEAYKVPTASVFNAWQFSWSAINVIPAHVLFESYTIGPNMANPILGP